MDELEKCRAEIDAIDSETAELFRRRMEVSGRIARLKAERGLDVTDPAREAEVIRRNEGRVGEELRPLYREFLRRQMALSKRHQREILSAESNGRVLFAETGDGAYPVYFRRGGLPEAGKLFSLDRKVMVVTDDGVPEEYAKTVASQCGEGHLFSFPSGEGSKTLATLEKLLLAMQNAEFTRTDAVVSVGGGVVGDLAGLAASLYMRGVDFYNIPTTLLSQLDSSVGGKTAVDLDSVKNAVGAFYPPRGVLIDADLLATLPARQMNAGLAEALKVAVTSDAELFRVFEVADPVREIENVTERAIRVKLRVVAEDEREVGIRKILNFGHTFGHGLEAAQSASVSPLLHGECVAVGMLPFVPENIRKRLLPIYRKLSLPTGPNLPTDVALRFARHDKKRDGDLVSAVFAPAIGSYEIRKIPLHEFEKTVRSCFGEGSIL